MRRSPLKFLIPLTLLVALAYGNALSGDFLWDDEFLIVKNSYLRDISSFPKMLVSNSTAGFGGKDNFYRPTQNILYLGIFQTFGLSKVAFHLGNILIHLINAFLIFFLIRKLFAREFLAFTTASLWAVHPTHVEAVTYISGTADPLSLLFCLACLLCFPFDKQNHKALGLSFGFYFLALLSKEAIIVTPALICLVQALKNKKLLDWKPYLKTLPFWILSFAYLLARKYWLNFNETYSFYKQSNIYTENMIYRAYTYFATLPEYLEILFKPTHLHMERSFPVFIQATSLPVVFGLSITFLGLAISLYFLLKKNNRKPLFCWLWFFMSFVPMMGILVPVNSFILEHWLYLPSIGLFLGLAFIIDDIYSYKKPAGVLLISVSLLPLVYFTHQRNKDWQTPLTFYQNILKYSEGTARVHNNLAMAYSSEEKWVEAIKHYQKAIEMSDIYAQTHYNLARALIRQSQFQQALIHLNRSLEIDANFKYASDLKSELLSFLKKARQ